MTVAAFNGQALDLLGNVITDFQVEVRHETAGASLATIYSDRAGATPLGNPFTPSALDNGHFRFHVAGGAYKVRAFNASTGFEKVWRYVAIGLAAESDDAIHFPGYLMLFDATVGEEELGIDDGEVRADNADLSAATELYVSKNNAVGDSIEDRLDELGAGDVLVLTASDGSQASWNVTSVEEGLGSPTNYVVINVTQHAGATSFDDGEALSLQFQLKGDTGEVPESRTLTAGSGLTGGGDLSANRTFTVGAGTGITVNADDVAVDKASDANVRAAASNKVITTDLVESASAVVTLTDAATIAVDWDSGINFQVTLTTNRILGNPTNGQPGTWRTVLVKSDGGPDTLTFGNQYGGTVPTIDDVTTTQFYLLMIYCKTSSQFLVSAIDGSDA